MSTSYALSTETGMSSTIVMLDSEDATQYLATRLDGRPITSFFRKTLGTAIVPPATSAVLVSLHSATIPYSWYNLRENLNDKLDFYVTDNDEVSNRQDFTFTIPSGNYGSTTLRQALINGIHGLSGVVVNIEFIPTTYKFRFSTAGSRVVFLDFNGTHGATSPYKELGFDKGQTDLKIKAGAPLVSDHVIDLNGSVHGLYIRTNLSSDTVIDHRGFGSNVISRVPITVPNGGLIFYSPSEGSHHKHLVGNSPISQITVQLTDPRNRVLDLNGLHWQCQIALDFIVNRPTLRQPRGNLTGLMAEQLEQLRTLQGGARKKSRRRVKDVENRKKAR